MLQLLKDCREALAEDMREQAYDNGCGEPSAADIAADPLIARLDAAIAKLKE